MEKKKNNLLRKCDLKMNKVLISVILPTYNRISTIKYTLESLLNQSFRDFEVIIVDDTPNDRVYGFLYSNGYLNKDNVIYYKNSRRSGLPASRNRGVLLARGNLILFIEDDVILDRDALLVLYATYKVVKKKAKKLGAIVPARPIIIVNYTSPLLTSFIMKHLKRPVIESPITRLIYQKYDAGYISIFEIPTGHPCALFEKETLIKIGLFDYKTFRGSFEFEETDLFTRLKRSGFFIVYQPKAILYHIQVNEGGCKAPLFKKAKSFISNYVKYLTKHYDAISLLPRLMLALVETSVMFVLTKLEAIISMCTTIHWKQVNE
jgi:glycosyltransferase involved in cell wall biosynthesis